MTASDFASALRAAKRAEAGEAMGLGSSKPGGADWYKMYKVVPPQLTMDYSPTK